MSDVEDGAGSPASSCVSVKSNRSRDHPPSLSDGPGPSDSRVDNREIKASRVKSCDSDVKLDPDTADTKLDVCEDDAELMKPPSSFTPELQTESTRVSYRFRCPGPGGFQCTSTGLVFVMAQEAELLYRTVHWDESLLQSAGKMAAGPLFDIQCPEDAVCQLHLPHCETEDAVRSEGLLSVVHITDDGMSILEPLEITDTHVIVKVPHLSAFGLVWNFLESIWNNRKQVSGQVMLFLPPPNPRTQKQNLNVHLLPGNIPLDVVKAQQEDCKHIQAPSICELIKDQKYTVHCPKAHLIQPEKSKFYLEFGPNYPPMFQIRLPINTQVTTITVRDETNADVWTYEVELTGLGPGAAQSFPVWDQRFPVWDQSFPVWDQSVPAEEKLKSVRPQFITRVSEAVLHNLLDKLLHRGVITDGEMEFIGAQIREEKARELIDTVRKKGSAASSALIAALCEEDHWLSAHLNLRTFGKNLKTLR